MADGFDIAATLSDAGLGEGWVDRVAAGVGDGDLAAGLRFVGACAGTRTLLRELEEAAGRIATLVDAVRSYSYLDQAPRQTVDVQAGVESTLSLLGHKLRAKHIEIVRDLDPDLPVIEASGPELNQVWTNLIDNAVDAMDDGGRLTLRTRRQGDRVCVEIGDDGPGIRPSSERACSTRSSPPSPSARAPAWGSTSPSGSSCATTASCGSSRSPATPASGCCCPAEAQTARRERSAASSASLRSPAAWRPVRRRSRSTWSS